MTKLTIASKFDAVIALLDGQASDLSVDDAKAFLAERKAQAQKKASSKKATDRQVENESLKSAILDALDGVEDGMTVTEIMGAESVASFPTDAPLTNQRVTAVLRLMKEKDGTVRKDKVGKAMKYFVA